MIQRLIGILGSVFGTLLVLYATIRLLHIDPQPIVLNTARAVGGGNLVEFNEAFQANFDRTIRVCSVERIDTDGDSFNEWVVFYQNDPVALTNWRQPCPDASPRFGAIYDNDRGEPAIIFPYGLQPFDGDKLGEAGAFLQTDDIVANFSETDTPIPELLVYGQGGGTNNQLTVFKFEQNTLPWESPTNMPARYKVIGQFEGSGGVIYDPTTKNVTVQQPWSFGRSQLIVKNTYTLRGGPGHETYMSSDQPTKLERPIRSYIDFAFGPPQDILNTEFPEKIMLAFYQSLDNNINAGLGWNPADFLAPIGNNESIGNAARNYAAGNFGYFFAPDNQTTIPPEDLFGLRVVQVSYYPKTENQPANRTIEGPQPCYGEVDVTIEGDRIPQQLIKYRMVRLSGQWKINERISHGVDQGAPINLAPCF